MTTISDASIETWSQRTQQSKNKDVVFIEDFEYLNTSSQDWTPALQGMINYLNNLGGGVGRIKAREYYFSQITWKNNVGIIGEGPDVSILSQIVDTNLDAIIGTNVEAPRLENFMLNCNYLSGNRYSSSTVVNNIGNGINFDGVRAHYIDISIRNVGGIGLFLKKFTGVSTVEFGQLPFVQGHITECRKEGVVIQGAGNDGRIGNLWVGINGLYPLSELNDSSVVKNSDLYPSKNRIDGIVIDSTNLEYSTLHTWANWFGCGFTTVGNCRMTGGTIISESNSKQLDISSGTYGYINFDLRNLALFHPSYNEGYNIAESVYNDINNMPDLFKYQAVISAGASFKCSINIRRIQIGKYHVPYVNSILATSQASISLNETSTVGTVSNSTYEIGTVFKGDLIHIEGDMGNYDITANNCNGSVYVLGGRNKIGLKLSNFVNSTNYSLIRNSNNNSANSSGNFIFGVISDCSLGFQSIGQPQTETIELQLIYNSNDGDIPFLGDYPSISKVQDWKVIFLDRATLIKKTTSKWSAKQVLDLSDTIGKYITITHNFAYKPDISQCNLSIYSNAAVNILEYCYISDIADTTITISYKINAAQDTNLYLYALLSIM